MLWERVSHRTYGFEQEETKARREILSAKFLAQLNSCTRAFVRCLPDYSFEELRREIVETIVAMRCYRTYVNGQIDSPTIDPFLSKALKRTPLLAELFSGRTGKSDIMDALRRFHQLSAPVAAKAVEDTALYRYGRLLSRNDVGFNPRRRFLVAEQFHVRVQARHDRHPHNMLTTATHDHKRGEDSRARLAALSAEPQSWQSFVGAAPLHEALQPDDIYMLLQTLFGAWCGAPSEQFAQRIEAWCRKFLREAKLRSSWEQPNKSYEDRMCHFARDLLLNDVHEPFRRRLNDLLARIAPIARRNSLAQAVLRCTLPGVPDLYQGAEYLDLSMVDPDNRQPVNFAVRRTTLAAGWRDHLSLDQQKQWVIAKLLRARAQVPDLWEKGSYEPLVSAAGTVAFVRRHKNRVLTVVALCKPPLGPHQTLSLDTGAMDLLTTRRWRPGVIAIQELLHDWPATVLLGGTTSLN
jgi:(1->4)-alpha-D-glucan 1-alpha-D-glucosylmutase